jgi:hypothetical protein
MDKDVKALQEEFQEGHYEAVGEAKKQAASRTQSAEGEKAGPSSATSGQHELAPTEQGGEQKKVEEEGKGAKKGEANDEKTMTMSDKVSLAKREQVPVTQHHSEEDQHQFLDLVLRLNLPPKVFHPKRFHTPGVPRDLLTSP